MVDWLDPCHVAVLSLVWNVNYTRSSFSSRALYPLYSGTSRARRKLLLWAEMMVWSPSFYVLLQFVTSGLKASLASLCRDLRQLPLPSGYLQIPDFCTVKGLYGSFTHWEGCLGALICLRWLWTPCLGFSLSLDIAAGSNYFCFKRRLLFSTLRRGKTGHLLPYLCTCQSKLKTI